MKAPEVLIVDDEEDICMLAGMILKNIGVASVCVHTVSYALIEVEKKEFPIILLDNHLPDGFGIDHIAAIKEKSPRSKIVIVTAYDDIGEKALEKGADYFMSKPFSKEKIQNIVSQFLVDSWTQA